MNGLNVNLALARSSTVARSGEDDEGKASCIPVLEFRGDQASAQSELVRYVQLSRLETTRRRGSAGQPEIDDA
jgi:hypothetical protein